MKKIILWILVLILLIVAGMILFGGKDTEKSTSDLKDSTETGNIQQDLNQNPVSTIDNNFVDENSEINLGELI